MLSSNWNWPNSKTHIKSKRTLLKEIWNLKKKVALIALINKKLTALIKGYSSIAYLINLNSNAHSTSQII